MGLSALRCVCLFVAPAEAVHMTLMEAKNIQHHAQFLSKYTVYKDWMFLRIYNDHKSLIQVLAGSKI